MKHHFCISNPKKSKTWLGRYLRTKKRKENHNHMSYDQKTEYVQYFQRKSRNWAVRNHSSFLQHASHLPNTKQSQAQRRTDILVTISTPDTSDATPYTSQLTNVNCGYFSPFAMSAQVKALLILWGQQHTHICIIFKWQNSAETL